MDDHRELLVDLKTGRTRPLVARKPILSSSGLAWRGVLLEHHESRPFELNDVRLVNNVVFLQLSSPCELELRLNGHFEPLLLQPGQISLIPAHLPHSARSHVAGGEFLSVSVEQRFLGCVANELVDPTGLKLEPKLCVNDRLIEGICRNLLAEAQAGGLGGRLYSDSLTAALAMHLLRRYSSKNSQDRELRGGMSKHQLRRALDFINDRLSKELSLQSIASEVGMSLYHFAHRFKQSTGLAPHQYLIRCRLERARQMLLRSEKDIAKIALSVGFCDQSHFTQHFRRAYGVTPKRFVREMSACDLAFVEGRDLQPCQAVA